MISYFNNRLNQLFNQIEISGYDGFYITNMTNIRYLTGFTGSSAILFILNQKAYFLTDGRYIVQSKNEVKNSEIFIIDKSYFENTKYNIYLTDERNVKLVSKRSNYKNVFKNLFDYNLPQNVTFNPPLIKVFPTNL